MDGFGLMLIVGHGRAFGYLAWYHAIITAEVVAAIPDRETLVRDIRWAAPPAYGTCNPAHFRKMELVELGVFPVDPCCRDRVQCIWPRRDPAGCLGRLERCPGVLVARSAYRHSRHRRLAGRAGPSVLPHDMGKRSSETSGRDGVQ